MFSYFQGNLRNARRATPSHLQSTHQSGTTSNSQEGLKHAQQHSSTAAQYSPVVESYQSPVASSPPPSLPPIPRVASYNEYHGKQYSGVLRDESEVRAETDDGRQVFANQESGLQTAGKTRIGSTFTGSTQNGYVHEAGISYSFEASQDHFLQLAAATTLQDPHKKQGRSYTEPAFNQFYRSDRREVGSVQDQSYPTRGQSSNPTNLAQSTTTLPIPAKHGRPKLNLRNPIAILSRKRTGQTSTQPTDYAYLQTRPSSARSTLPDDYDPRIRGKVVHDFSAPRPVRYGASKDSVETRAKEHNVSAGQDDVSYSQRSGEINRYSDTEPKGASWDNRSSPQRTPVFKEHFENELEPWRFDSNDRRNQNTTGLLERMPDHKTDAMVSSLPPFARSFPTNVAKNLHMATETFEFSNGESVLVKPSVLSENVVDAPQRQAPQVPTSTTSPPKSRSRATSINDALSQGSGLPKHMRSNASRFSFDLAGVGSAAQEKLLEDKHRQKTARKPRDSTLSAGSNVISNGDDEDDEEDFYDEDLDFDNGLEEKIPGVNTAEEEEYDMHLPPNQIFDISVPRNTQQPPHADTPGHAFYLQNPNQYSAGNPFGFEVPEPQAVLDPIRQQKGEQISASNSSAQPNGQASSQYSQSVGEPDNRMGFQTHKLYDDDLYFDDGMIDDFDVPEGEKFDESVFDDESSRIYGLPLRDLKPLPVLLESSSAETSQLSTRPISTDSPQMPFGPFTETKSEADRKSMPPPSSLPLRKSSLVNRAETTGLIFDQSAGLTQTNLDAYHSALAMAADRAAREGRFDRKASISESLDEGRRLRVSFDENQTDQFESETNHAGSHGAVEDFDFNDDEDDDAIIAAANAEALENDEEGVYGQEFGFFAHANGSAEAMYANGGYFGVKADGVKRSHSGKANFQEPNLTPISERSEWSQRNSMISMAMQGVYPQSFPHPGLSQLADAMQYEEGGDNMSLSALMKLRKGTFGGSSTSLHSLGSRSASPSRLNVQIPTGIQSNGINGSHLAESNLGLASAFEDGYSSESPTLTLQTHGLLMNPNTPLTAEKSSGSDSSPKRRNAVRAMGHSRNSSGAESVSYVTETDEDGAKRWVLEKRRMVEGGGMEILGRQIVEGGRI
jgi:hypothetical protein